MSESVLTSLLTEQELAGSIPCSSVRFFSKGELFHNMYGLGVHVGQLGQFGLFFLCCSE